MTINPSTKINFELSGYHDNVTFTVFNVTGQIVNQISFLNTLPGMQVISWNGINSNGASVPSGIYFYQVQAGDVVSVREKAKKQLRIQSAMSLAAQRGHVDWIDVSEANFQGTYKSSPERADLPSEINESLIVELYSK